MLCQELRQLADQMLAVADCLVHVSSDPARLEAVTLTEPMPNLGPNADTTASELWLALRLLHNTSRAVKARRLGTSVLVNDAANVRALLKQL